MKIEEIISGTDATSLLNDILNRIHLHGPVDARDFEDLAYIKKFQPQLFKDFERKLISLMGLFYKNEEPQSLLEELYSVFAKAIVDELGVTFTPVQADAFRKINNNIYYSFSAPTSAGKSFLFRELLKRVSGDIVIVVPSRALIAEYIHIISSQVENDVMVLQFIEIVNTLRTKRRIFVITPERGVELFKNIELLNVQLFLFDEAQISEEDVRGMKFDSFVRRVDRVLPNAKKVFTHPFVQNPEAQLTKHDFKTNADSFCYRQHSVGKIFMSAEENFNYFSSHEIGKINFIPSNEDIVAEKLIQNGTVLIYTSKKKIYDGTFLLDFAKYIELCPKLTDPDALDYVNELREYIGASQSGSERHSIMIDMMEKGIVIHHGSIPLKARLMIESFVNANHARICFSTSTLIQGINMPFDIVWINNFSFTGSEAQKRLDLKNLIGRAGRSTSDSGKFDYGYVIVEPSNVRTFRARLQEVATLSPISLLDEPTQSIDEDQRDIVTAMKDNTFNDELQLTQTQVDRLTEADLDADIEFILKNLIVKQRAIKAKEYYALSKPSRTKIKNSFQLIYISHLRRKELTKAEKMVLSASIPILLWRIQGKSFREIVSLRYAYLSRKDELRAILNRLKAKEITPTKAKELRDELFIHYSPIAAPLPNKKLTVASLFGRDRPVIDLEYDILVYDTYDYLDKVIAFSLSDPLSAAFQLYFEKTNDPDALAMVNYIRYGTNDYKEIWLLRYGFSFDEVEWLDEYVESVDETQIVFSPGVESLEPEKKDILSKFL